MADTTPSKRVLPARERRESAAKRRASSPVVQPPPVAKPTTTPQTEPEPPRQKRKYTKRASLVKVIERTPDSSTPGLVEEALPTRISASKPLPVLPEKQAETLSNSEYQSFADSAILASSLHRSRMQWLCEGIFKKYWVKPVKRKGVIEQPPGNPDVKTMQKLGNATIAIEPHTFDVTFYTVRDPNAVQTPYQRHPNQHTTKPSHGSYPSTGGFLPAQAGPQTQPRPVSHPSTPQAPAAANHGGAQPHKPGPAAPAAGPAASTVPAKANTAPPKPTDDPVIQMLAARAATDPRLKDLMKVVAMSQASPEQLREFQAHIDEFNAVVKQREAKKAEAEQRAKAAAAVGSTIAGGAAATPLPRPGPGPGPGPGPSAGGATHMQPPAYPVYHPPYRPEPIIKHIVLEFHSPVSGVHVATTDRWLFPEHAVLEMQPGGVEMIASFFAERRGADIVRGMEDGNGDGDRDGALGQTYAADVDYYEPVTMKITATQHRTIETIARAATTLPDVVKHMKAVMAQKTRAPREYLVYRLPRERALIEAGGPASDFVDSGVDVSGPEDDELKEYYGV